jgi:hypothetical protein
MSASEHAQRMPQPESTITSGRPFGDPAHFDVMNLRPLPRSGVRLDATVELYRPTIIEPDSVTTELEQPLLDPSNLSPSDKERYARIYGLTKAAALCNVHYVAEIGVESAAAQQAYSEVPLFNRLSSLGVVDGEGRVSLYATPPTPEATDQQPLLDPSNLSPADQLIYAHTYGEALDAVMSNKNFFARNGSIEIAAAQQAYSEVPEESRMRSLADPEAVGKVQGYDIPTQGTAPALAARTLRPVNRRKNANIRRKLPITERLAPLAAAVYVIGIVALHDSIQLISTHEAHRTVSAPKGERRVDVIGEEGHGLDDRELNSNFYGFTLELPSGRQVVIKPEASGPTIPEPVDLPTGSYKVIVSEGGPSDRERSILDGDTRTEKITIPRTGSDSVPIPVPWL